MTEKTRSSTIGEYAYEKYREFSGGKSLVSGQEIPPYEGLPAEIKGAWEYSAAHLVAAVGRADAAPATQANLVSAEPNDAA